LDAFDRHIRIGYGRKGIKMNKEQITIMTMNLRFGLAKDGDNCWEGRQDLVGRILDRYQEDFYGFQEANHFQINFLSRHLVDHEHIGQYNKEVPWWQSNMIFYHNSWTCLGFRHHFLSRTPDIPSKLIGSKWPRQCVVGWFQKEGVQLLVVNTHFDFDPDVQARGAGLVMEFIDRFPPGLPVVIGGDFNAEPGSLAYERFMSNGFNEVLSGKNVTTFHEFKGGNFGPHIDWLLFKGGLDLVQAGVVMDEFSGRFPSDHYPVRAEFGHGDALI